MGFRFERQFTFSDTEKIEQLLPKLDSHPLPEGDDWWEKEFPAVTPPKLGWVSPMVQGMLNPGEGARVFVHNWARYYVNFTKGTNLLGENDYAEGWFWYMVIFAFVYLICLIAVFTNCLVLRKNKFQCPKGLGCLKVTLFILALLCFFLTTIGFLSSLIIYQTTISFAHQYLPPAVKLLKYGTRAYYRFLYIIKELRDHAETVKINLSAPSSPQNASLSQKFSTYDVREFGLPLMALVEWDDVIIETFAKYERFHVWQIVVHLTTTVMVLGMIIYFLAMIMIIARSGKLMACVRCWSHVLLVLVFGPSSIILVPVTMMMNDGCSPVLSILLSINESKNGNKPSRENWMKCYFSCEHCTYKPGDINENIGIIRKFCNQELLPKLEPKDSKKAELVREYLKEFENVLEPMVKHLADCRPHKKILMDVQDRFCNIVPFCTFLIFLAAVGLTIFLTIYLIISKRVKKYLNYDARCQPIVAKPKKKKKKKSKKKKEPRRKTMKKEPLKEVVVEKKDKKADGAGDTTDTEEEDYTCPNNCGATTVPIAVSPIAPGRKVGRRGRSFGFDYAFSIFMSAPRKRKYIRP